MPGEDLDKFEAEAAESLKSIGRDVPVSESKILSNSILDILMKNARTHGDVEYASGDHRYSVSFGFAEVRLEDGNLGLYNELPDELTPEDAETVAFLVTGFHKEEETEVQFSEGKILLNADRLHGHIVEFQRAVISKGVF